MSPPFIEERLARAEILEAGRRMYEHRLIVALQGNLSARVGEDRILTTPAGVCKGTLCDADLMIVDRAGKSADGRRPSSELAMHLAIYDERSDIAAIIHGHPTYATAFATAGRDLDLCLLPEVIVGLGAIPLSRYATPGTAEVGEVARELVRGHDAFLLRNHGAVACGDGVMNAFYKMETLEHLSRIVLLAELAGGPTPLSRDQVEGLAAIAQGYGTGGTRAACRAAEDVERDDTSPRPPSTSDPERAALARIVAEEIARALEKR